MPSIHRSLYIFCTNKPKHEFNVARQTLPPSGWPPLLSPPLIFCTSLKTKAASDVGPECRQVCTTAMNNGSTQPHSIFVISDSPSAHLTLMNPDTDYKPSFKRITPDLPTQFPHSGCQTATTKRLPLLSYGHAVNIWCGALLVTNNTGTLVVSADVENVGLFHFREEWKGLIKQVADAAIKDIWRLGWKFESCIRELLKGEDQERGAH